MILYELINMSDPYTFYAPSIEVAGVCAVRLSPGFGAAPADGEGESTPLMFGWEEWLEAKGVDAAWVEAHRAEIAAAYESFLIGDAAKRADVESMLAMLPEEKRAEWRLQRQDRHRTSLNKIGERAYELAAALRPEQEEART